MDLVRSMFQIRCKVAELERTKLQMEIQKERSEIRQKQLENRLRMASANPNPGKGGGRSGQLKNPKKPKTDKEDDD